MNRTLLAYIICTLVPFASASEPPPGRIESIPFRAGTDGYFAYRIPSLVVTNQGTLLAFCEGRKTTLSDDGDNDLVLRRSFDGGRTWGPLQLVHEEGGDAVVSIGNPCAVVDRTTGDIWLSMNRKNGRVLVVVSRDDGKTWSPPRDITKETSAADWGWYAMGPGCGIQLKQGPHAGRLVIPANHRTTPDRRGPSASHIIYSDDHGQTWLLGGTVALHTNECQVAELTDGKLVINCRNHWARSGGKPELNLKRIESRSTDGGLTWSEPTFADTLIEPTCQAGLIALSKPAADGKTRLVFSNPASTKTRERMTLRLSEDGGATWPKSLLIHSGSSAYSSPAELTDGNVGLLYERDNYREITFCTVKMNEWK